jgi:hypothetical protein
LYLAGLIQLAQRHPDVPVSNLRAGERFLAAVRDSFADCPAA